MCAYTVYKHTSPSGKVYIGITGKTPELRWRNGRNYKSCPYFHHAIQKYGWDNFTHEILFTGLTKEEACIKEGQLISEYQSDNPDFGYNLNSGGGAGFTGGHHSEETKLKIANAHKGMKMPPWSEEHKRKLSESLTNNPKKSKIVYQYDLDLNLIRTYPSVCEAYRQTLVSADRISKCARGKIKNAGGYIWSYTPI